ncbi:MAG: acyl-CoA dehydrogenase family protein [Caulobacterales bacterium]
MTVHELSRPNGTRVVVSPAPRQPGGRLSPDDLVERARRVAAIAAVHADDVDREGRYPAEAMAAAKAEGLLGVMAPAAFGGEAASLSRVADVCYTLGRACASTAMVYAMHQVKVACVIRHGIGSAWHEAFIRTLVENQLLLASSTTEGQGGGNVRSSEAPVQRSGDRISLERAASVISYGEQADVVVTTARRAADAAASDQVLIVFMRDDYSLEPTLSWDTLGMRGTCSAGFTLRASGGAAQILPAAYEIIHTQSMVPTAHLLWSSAWAGVAAAAVERARRYVRKAARTGGGDLPPSAPYLTRANASLRAVRALIATMLDRYEAIAGDPEALSAIDFQSAISLLKVDASELAVASVMSALRTCGLSGYRNDSDVSIGRHLRDVLSAPIMINNDRILANVASAALLSEVATSIRD